MAKANIRTGEADQPVHTRTTASTEESQVAVLGIDGSDSVVPADASSGLSVRVTNTSLTVADGGSTLSIDDGGGSLTVDGTVAVTGVATAANQTTVIGHLDGVEGLLTTIDADTGALGATGDAAATVGSTGTLSAKLRLATTQLDAIQAAVQRLDDAIAGSEMQVDVVGALPSGTNTLGAVRIVPTTSQGLTISTPLISAASTNATVIKASAGQLYGWYVYNANASVRYLKIYNKATAPTVGTDTPVMVIPIPPSSGANVVSPLGLAFSTGISLALTTGVANSDTGAVAASELVVNLFYA